jgi:hypothetical protein
MKSRAVLWPSLLLLLLASGGGAALLPAAETTAALNVPAATDILATLRSHHPRLLLSPEDLDSLRQRVTAVPQLREWQDKLRDRAQRILNEPPSRYEIPDGLRLLSTSRRVVDRVYTLALLFHLEGDPRYATRAWEELAAAAAFPDWNPRHFLDTAEMTHAFAIGYDWLYHHWTPDQRDQLRSAMVEKGLNPALEVHRRSSGWHRVRHNWNQVCNGGIGMGALALADVEPALAAEFLAAAIPSIQLAMREYGPDGAWAEGPGYWRYATQYNVVFLAALETALGTDFGLGETPGFREAGLFPLHLTGPLGRTFNYADGGDGTIRSPELFWLAQRFSAPAYADYQARVASPQALDLVWFPPGFPSGSGPTLPLDRYFRGAEVVTLRNAWDQREAMFVGFKGGDNRANHSNLDLGSFVLDALGERWVLDLGADDYNLPGYFGKQRWTYYRLRAEGHNTLVLNPGTAPDQDPAGKATVTRFHSTPSQATAVVDLTAAYAAHARSVQRGIALRERDSPAAHVVVQDEIDSADPVDLWWFLHTPAEVELTPDARTATLKRGGKQLRAVLLEPAHARFAIREARPLPTSPQPDRQNPNPGIRKLAIHLPDTTRLRLAVRFQPVLSGSESPSATASAEPVPALRDW